MKRIFGKIKKNCTICREPFYVHRYRELSALFCSRECNGITSGKRMIGNTYSIGKIPWNKGKKGLYKASEETKKKMSISINKAYENPELRKKLSELHRGEKSYLWKGGITKENQMQRVIFQNTIKKDVLERDNYTCTMCGKRGVVLHVDHIQSWSEYVKLRFEISNCRTLCEDCHYFVTWGKKKPENVKTWGRNFRAKEEICA